MHRSIVHPLKLFSLLLLLSLGWQHSALGAEKRILVLETMDAPIVQEFTQAFLQRFRELEPSNSTGIRRLNAKGDPSRARALLEEELRTAPPDLVVGVATLASKAACEVLAGQNIPIVFMCVTDPVGAGLIPAMETPSPNVTGKIHYISAETKLNLILKMLESSPLPRPLRFGYIYTDYPADLSDYNRLQRAAAHNNGIVFVPVKIPYRPVSKHKQGLLKEVRAAAARLQGKIDYFWSPRGALAVLPEYDDILLGFPATPLIAGATESAVKKGALAHITGDPVSQARDTATLCSTILQGRSPGAIPPSLPGDIQFSINLKTAATLELPVPSDILELAKGHIYPRP